LKVFSETEFFGKFCGGISGTSKEIKEEDDKNEN